LLALDPPRLMSPQVKLRTQLAQLRLRSEESVETASLDLERCAQLSGPATGPTTAATWQSSCDSSGAGGPSLSPDSGDAAIRAWCAHKSGAAGAGSAVTTAVRYDAFGPDHRHLPLHQLQPRRPLPRPDRSRPDRDTDLAGTGSDPLYAMGARARG
jgi:hypothetical protein